MKTPSKFALFGVRNKLRKLLEMSRQDYDDSLLEAANLRSSIRRLKTENQALLVLAKDAANPEPSLNQVKEFLTNCDEDSFMEINQAFISRSMDELLGRGSSLGGILGSIFSRSTNNSQQTDIKTASDADLLTLCKRLEAIPTNRRTPKMQQALEACSKELLSR